MRPISRRLHPARNYPTWRQKICSPSKTAEAFGAVKSKRTEAFVSFSVRECGRCGDSGVGAAVVDWDGLYGDGRATNWTPKPLGRPTTAHAEKIALDYAVNAATMDYKDLRAWHRQSPRWREPVQNLQSAPTRTSMEQVVGSAAMELGRPRNHW